MSESHTLTYGFPALLTEARGHYKEVPAILTAIPSRQTCERLDCRLCSLHNCEQLILFFINYPAYGILSQQPEWTKIFPDFPSTPTLDPLPIIYLQNVSSQPLRKLLLPAAVPRHFGVCGWAGGNSGDRNSSVLLKAPETQIHFYEAMTNICPTLFGLYRCWRWRNKTNKSIISMSLFINSNNNNNKKARSYKNKLNAIWEAY